MNAPATAAAVKPPVQISTPAITMIPLPSINLSQSALQVLRRSHFTPESLAELAADIKAHGVMQPVMVRESQAQGYEMIAGERRYLAAKQAGLGHVPAIVRAATDSEAVELQFAENIQRESLHELEEALGYQMLCKIHKCTAKDLAPKVGKNEAHIHARMKLLDLCNGVRADFYAGKVNASIALLIARITDPIKQAVALEGCLRPRGPGTHGLPSKAMGKFDAGHYQGPLTFADAKDYIQQEFIVYQDGARAIEEAKKKGIPTKALTETGELWKREYAPPAGHIIVDDKVKAKLGDVPTGAQLWQNPHTGEAHLVLKKEKAVDAFKEKKIALPQDLKPRPNYMGSSGGGSGPRQPSAESEARRLAKAEHEERKKQLGIDIRVAIFQALRKKTPAKLGKAELLDILGALDNVDHTIAPRPKGLTKCQEKDLTRFVLDEIYGDNIDSRWCDDDEFEHMYAAAKRYGVNAAAIAKDLTEEFEESEAELAGETKPKADAKPAAVKKPAKKKAAKK